MTFTVRPVSSADAPALAELLNAVIRAGGTLGTTDPLGGTFGTEEHPASAAMAPPATRKARSRVIGY